MNKLSDKEIAQKVLDLTDAHEKSWNNNKSCYEKGDWWKNNIEPFLDEHAEYAAFALSLAVFGWDSYNDVIDMCESIVNETVHKDYDLSKDNVKIKSENYNN